MGLMITDECINCGVCLPECPNGAIMQDDDGSFFIRMGLCTECVGTEYAEPHCRALCPVSECLIVNPRKAETREMLLEKHRRIELKNKIASAMKAAGI